MAKRAEAKSHWVGEETLPRSLVGCEQGFTTAVQDEVFTQDDNTNSCN